MLNIGGFKPGSMVMLAPMAGVTDTAFRILCRELGYRGLMFTEMVSAKGLSRADAKSYALARATKAERPFAIQIFGGDPDDIVQAIEAIAECGAGMIDINMGCPMPKITRNGEGAALMLDAKRAQAIVRAAVAAVPPPMRVSVKIRKGWDDEHINAVDFAQRLEEAGAAMITVHGRTRAQLYGGMADWDIIAKVKQAVGVPVIGNGDIFGVCDAMRMIVETGCDGVMVGRAARGNPWLLCDIERAADGGATGPAGGMAEANGGATRSTGGMAEAARATGCNVAEVMGGMAEAARVTGCNVAEVMGGMAEAGGGAAKAGGAASRLDTGTVSRQNGGAASRLDTGTVSRQDGDAASRQNGGAASRLDSGERTNVMKRHLELAVAARGERMGVLEMRKHLAWYVKGMRGSAAIKNDLFRIADYNELMKFIESLELL